MALIVHKTLEWRLRRIPKDGHLVIQHKCQQPTKEKKRNERWKILFATRT